MELICPMCNKWTEIPERQAFAGNRCRCQACWAPLRIDSGLPFRVHVEPSSVKSTPKIGSGIAQGGKEHD